MKNRYLSAWDSVRASRPGRLRSAAASGRRAAGSRRGRTLDTRLVWAGAAVLLLVLAWLVAPLLPLGIDWRDTYRPATLALLHARNPYDADVAPVAPFFAAPWGLLPLIPLAVLPLEVGRAFLLFISLGAFAYAAHALGARPIGLGAFLISPPVVHCLLNANIEWIPLLGFVLPPQIGLFFVAVKPQTGFAVAAFWLVEAWRQGGWRQVIRTFGPVALAFLLSFALFGLWPFRFDSVLSIAQGFNASLWPYSIPVGLALFAWAVYKREIRFAMPVSPCLSPYVLFHSWTSALVAISAQDIAMVAAMVALWVLVIVQAV